MTPKEFYKRHPKEHIESMVKSAGTSFGHFQQIAGGYTGVSSGLAERLCTASLGAMTELEILYPERFSEAV